MPGKVYVPEVFQEYTTRRVLVTEWIEGPKLADILRNSSPEIVRTLLPISLECFLAQLLDIGRFHSDPHPGNLLVRGGKELVLLDFGLVANIHPRCMKHLTMLTVHLINAEYDSVFDDFIALGFLPADAERDEILPPLRSVLE